MYSPLKNVFAIDSPETHPAALPKATPAVQAVYPPPTWSHPHLIQTARSTLTPSTSMISMSTLLAAEKLLTTSMSRRQIAKRLHISRATLVTIAHRRHPLQRTPKPIEEYKLGRCVLCGAMAAVNHNHHCLACSLPSGASTRRYPSHSKPLTIALDLKPQDQSRYEEIRAYRQGSPGAKNFHFPKQQEEPPTLQGIFAHICTLTPGGNQDE